MLSNSNPYVYYTTFLGPSCLILLFSFVLFLMVFRVLLASRPSSSTSQRNNLVIGNILSAQQLVPLAQVRGCFTIAVLVGVTWVFGAFAVGELKFIFQYLFCVCCFLQGLLIFIVRCLFNTDARVSWTQFIRTGKLKKQRGVVPTTVSRFATSIQQERSMPASSRDSTTNNVFSSSYWKRTSRLPQTQRNSADQDAGWNRSCLTFAPLAASVQSITSEDSSLDRMSTTNYVEEDDQEPRTESSSDAGSYSPQMALPVVPGIDVSSQSSACTRSSVVGDEQPVCTFCGIPGCNESVHDRYLEAEHSYVSV